MWEYWFVFLIPAFLAVGNVRIARIGWLVIGVSISVFIGLRYGVGTDWGNYIRGYYLPAANQSLLETLASGDPAYRLLNWVVIKSGFGVWLVNLVVAVIFVSGLLRFVRRLPEANLALAAAVPYVGIVVAMNYSRQSAALGLILWSLVYFFDGKLVKYLIGIFLAALFHKSAIIFLPVIAVAGERVRIGMVLAAFVTAIAGYFLILAEKADVLWEQYVVSDYSQASEGGPVRVAMNAAPAALFILANRRIPLSTVERRFWLWVSCVALVCVPLVFIAPTAVDRVALYFTPLQFVVAAQLPGLFVRESRVLARTSVLLAYSCVLFVWLNYAANASYWLPYEFWPMFT